MTAVIPRKKKRDRILESSVPLFALRGYHGVSMRDIAAAIGLSPAALYYHFPDKEQLYIEVVAHAVRESAAMRKGIPNGLGSPWGRLEAFVAGYARLAATDRNFLRLLQWIFIDGDAERQQKLAEYVFRDLFLDVWGIVCELDSRLDPHMLVISIIGLVLFPCQTSSINRFMPGYRPQLENPEELARHVIDLLFGCLDAGKGATGSQNVAGKPLLNG